MIAARRILFLFPFLFLFAHSKAQTLGGSSAYNFLRLPSSPILTAAGGVITSLPANEVSLSMYNPALLNPVQHSQLALGFNALGGVKAYTASGALYKEELQTTFGGHIQFLDYGSIQRTDAAGNVMGDFRPRDFVVQVSASRSYLSNWQYGASLKFIQSSYEQFSSSALALDFGLLYKDSAGGFSASLLARNMGFPIKAYNDESEELPFDLAIGITKRLSKSPFGFSFTVQNLHRFNSLYDDTVYNNVNVLPSKNSFVNRLFNHFVFAGHVYIGSNLEATVSYNHLRKNELSITEEGNGMTGISLGLRVKFQKLQILYGRSSYQPGIAANHLGIVIQMNKLGGSGN